LFCPWDDYKVITYRHTKCGIVGRTKECVGTRDYSWAWEARPDQPGPKMAWPIGPKHAVGLGLGRNLRPDKSNRPGLGRKNAKLVKARPDGPTILWPDGPGLCRKMRLDSRARPGLGSSFWSRAFC
jgi:hypothetical protein